MRRMLRRIAFGVLFVLVLVVAVMSFQQATYTSQLGCDKQVCGSHGDDECGTQCCCGVKGETTPPCGRTNDGCVVR
jgi:hypothetical protein